MVRVPTRLWPTIGQRETTLSPPPFAPASRPSSARPSGRSSRGAEPRGRARAISIETARSWRPLCENPTPVSPGCAAVMTVRPHDAYAPRHDASGRARRPRVTRWSAGERGGVYDLGCPTPTFLLSVQITAIVQLSDANDLAARRPRHPQNPVFPLAPAAKRRGRRRPWSRARRFHAGFTCALGARAWDSPGFTVRSRKGRARGDRAPRPVDASRCAATARPRPPARRRARTTGPRRARARRRARSAGHRRAPRPQAPAPR